MANKKGRTDAGTPSPEYRIMQRARELPGMLDSSRPDGGINLLRENPGGRLFEQQTVRQEVVRTEGGDRMATPIVDPTQKPEFRPLLIQHEAEGNRDYAWRAMVAAPRNGFWHAVESHAGRPYKEPLTISDNAPEPLRNDGEWIQDADLNGNSLRTLAARQSRRSAGYGLGYWWVDFNARENRPFLRTVLAESMTRVAHEGKGQRFHVRMSRTEWENPGDAFDPSKFPVSKPVVLVFRDGDPDAVDGEGQWAWYEVYEATGKTGDEFSETPSPQLVEGEMISRVSLEPHREIPFVPFPTGEMSASHFILPPMMEAAQLDYLLLQVTSNLEYATILANTFIRFAKGIPESVIKEWQVLGPQMFYATTEKDADMKWVTLNGNALQSGMDLVEFLFRALEVAGLAPMLTRSTGDERATGQAISSARVNSVAEMDYLQWQCAIRDAVNLMSLHLPSSGTQEEISVTLTHDFNPSSQAVEQGNLLSRLYLDSDPSRRLDSATFYTELRRLGLLSENVDLDALIAATADPDKALEKARLSVDRVNSLVALAEQGHFSTQASSQVMYAALAEFGAFGAQEVDIVEMAAQHELTRQRKRNEELLLTEKITPANFWAAEEADEPVSVDLALETAAGTDTDEEI